MLLDCNKSVGYLISLVSYELFQICHIAKVLDVCKNEFITQNTSFCTRNETLEKKSKTFRVGECGADLKPIFVWLSCEAYVGKCVSVWGFPDADLLL